MGAEVLGDVSGVDRRRREVAPGRRLLASLLWQDFGQVDFGLRRFRLRPGPARDVLERSAVAFLTGFNAAASWPVGDRLASEIDRLDPPLRGFAFEGAGMACGLLDILGWGGRRQHVRALLAGPGLRYPHLIHVGVGWSFAWLRRRPNGKPWATPDPLLRWLAWDGFGFHQGFFHSDRVVGRRRVERGLTAQQRAIRDQGLGRSLWFHECADPEGVALRIGEFPASRRADLWAGIGLAASYAGGVLPTELADLAALSGKYRADLAQGCAFACSARLTSGILPGHTRAAAATLADATPETAAGWADRALAALGPHRESALDYAGWRAGIRELWADHTAGQTGQLA